ncbi:MAG TPA: hypothetical protein PK400_11295 [Phycisphaerales bacterium]|nr:hypothetical protein [Phycisphaerales bacterium]HRQ75755.1 hypothetical protein [Phycisphaerales bacterium]
MMFSVLTPLIVASAVLPVQVQDDAAPGVRLAHPARQLTTAHPPDPFAREVRPLFLALEIGEADLARYASILGLSPEQRAYLQRLHERYELDNLALMEERLEALWDDAARAASLGTAVLFDPESARLNSMVYDKREDYARRMVAVERNLFDALEAVLDDSQLINIERVRLLRERDHYEIPTTEIHGAQLDLSVMIDELERRFDSVQIIDRPALIVELEAHDRRLTALRRDLWHAWLRVMTRGVELWAQRSLATDAEVRKSLWAEREVLVRRVGRLTIELADLNERSVDRLVHFLDPQSAELLLRWYYAGAYPRVHPNHHDVRHVVNRILSEGSFPQDIVEAIQVMMHRYVTEETRLNARLRVECRRYGESRSLSSQGGLREEVFLEQVAAGRAERARLAQQVLLDIKALIPEDLMAPVQRAISDYYSTVSRLPDHLHDPTVHEDRTQAQLRESSTLRSLREVERSHHD